jgi:hypothetical protein
VVTPLLVTFRKSPACLIRTVSLPSVQVITSGWVGVAVNMRRASSKWKESDIGV